MFRGLAQCLSVNIMCITFNQFSDIVLTYINGRLFHLKSTIIHVNISSSCFAFVTCNDYLSCLDLNNSIHKYDSLSLLLSDSMTLI